MTYDPRAASLLADLRASDPLAREIIDRVDKGAYGVRGRRGTGSAGQEKVEEREESEGGGKAGSGSGGTTNVYAAGPPPSVQGRGRMVGLGQEMEMGGLINTQ